MNRSERVALLCGLLSVGACASTSRVQRQALPDGGYRVACTVALAQCLTAIEEVCPDGYEIVKAHQDVRILGPREITEPTATSEVVARCRSPRPVFGGSPKAAVAAPPEPTPGAADGAAPPPASPAPVPGCFPGVTQACIGPGGCRGGQVCLPEGAAFGPCDCGPAPPVAAPAPEAPAAR